MQLGLASPAKINLGLWVGGVRPDGFHDIVTTLAPLQLHDTVLISPAHDLKVTTDSNAAPGGPSNLAHRAAMAFFSATRINAGCHIHIHKRIPVGGGLGGGSSNAAIVLKGLNRMFGSPLTTRHLVRLATLIGSDVPFFLVGQPCVARGRGERLRPIRLPRLTLLLYVPPYPIPTAWAYQALDRLRARRQRLTSPRISPKMLCLRLRRGELHRAAPGFVNSFEDVVFRRHPELSQVRHLLMDFGAEVAALSGSGSTVYGLVRARRWKDPMAALQQHGFPCILTRTCGTAQ